MSEETFETLWRTDIPHRWDGVDLHAVWADLTGPLHLPLP